MCRSCSGILLARLGIAGEASVLRVFPELCKSNGC